MKQIDIIKTYRQKRCLIVDDDPDVRTSLKRILTDFGCNDIDTAGHAEEAFESCEKTNYDIVIADYQLGKGKNGQQLLEELRTQDLLKNTSIFIMITAEAAIPHVIHALEYQPDDYFNKPINRETLRTRLDTALLKNEALLDIKKALDLKRPQSAIEACKAVADKNGRFQNDAKKILGDLLCQQKLFEQALTIYGEYQADKGPLWARLGLAQSYYGLERLDDAESLLLDIINRNHYCVGAHDLLARIYEAKNKYQQAQEAIATAIKISPMSAARQREMGRICVESGDDNAAAHAFRAAIKLSKHSSLEKSEDYTDLSQTLVSMMRQDPLKLPELSQEALGLLEQLDRKFGKQPIVAMRSRLLNADIFAVSGDDERATKANDEALKIFNTLKKRTIENSSIQSCIDCAKALMERGKYDEGEHLLKTIATLAKEKVLQIKIDKLLREPVTKQGIAYAAKLNKRGIELHNKNQFENAVIAFQQVLRELPNHIGLNLNLIQSVISKAKNSEVNEKDIVLVENALQRIGDLGEDSAYKERFDYLLKRYQKMIV